MEVKEGDCIQVKLDGTKVRGTVLKIKHGGSRVKLSLADGSLLRVCLDDVKWKLKKENDKYRKRKRECEHENRGDVEREKPPSPLPSDSPSAYPYEADADDHCESPKEAYEHIAPILRALCTHLGKSPHELAIYDPYFCTGTVKDHLKELGFASCYNQKEDFYAVLREKRCPPFDCIVTNPPYSQDHMDKLTSFVAGLNKPWFLLMPNFVFTKQYWQSFASRRHPVPFYVAPKKRYLYTTPYGRRQQKSAKYTSPFPSFWYCGGMPPSCLPLKGAVMEHPDATLCPSGHSLPFDVLPENDDRKKKQKNALKRKKNKARKKLQT